MSPTRACKTCVDAGGTPLWQIVSKETTHDDGGHEPSTTGMRRFEIAGVPVLYSPYLAHPDPSVKRRTGFLLPQFKGGNAYGFGVVTPYLLGAGAQLRPDLQPDAEH